MSLDEFVASFQALIPPDTSGWAAASSSFNAAGGDGAVSVFLRMNPSKWLLPYPLLSLLRVETVLRLERDVWSMVKKTDTPQTSAPRFPPGFVEWGGLPGLTRATVEVHHVCVLKLITT